ncbi:DUF177 domain-containing protein [Rhodobacteraceae bacterium NNCM2]|nr:DUF177 domain-containing protein [Coraliihabitans acroporae]
MTHVSPETAPQPFHRPMPVERLDREGETAFEVTLTDEERAKAAEYLGIVSLNEIGFRGRITAWGENGWEAKANLNAIVVQECVVTLEPVTEYIEDTVDRRYLPGFEPEEEDEVIIASLAEDRPDPITDQIDLAALLLESLALSIDPYPRAEGAELKTCVFAEPGIKPMTDEDARPFAKLAALREKLGDDK